MVQPTPSSIQTIGGRRIVGRDFISPTEQVVVGPIFILKEDIGNVIIGKTIRIELGFDVIVI